MKRAIAFFAVAIALLLPASALLSVDYVRYNISIYGDGSSLWTIIHVTDIDTVVDDWEDFEQRLISTVNDAAERTEREMMLDFSSLEMSTEIHWETSSKTIKYVFLWRNFSKVDYGQINFGDIFSESFFSLLYGNGELYVTYPEEYQLSSVSIDPNEMDESARTLHWYRTQDFLVGSQIILFETDPGSNDLLNLFTLSVFGLGGIGIAVIVFLISKQRRKQKEKFAESEKLPSIRVYESDQDKILRLLESSGGNLKQSDVSNILRFSRAKTSLLLSEMEKNNLVRRIKKGKTKIIFRVESKEGDNL